MTFSQHGELVVNSAKNVCVNDAFEDFWAKRQGPAVGCGDFVCSISCVFLLRFEQGLPGYICRHEPTSGWPYHIASGPPAAGTYL